MMRPLSLSELRLPLEGQLHGADCDVLGVSTDSRTLHDGDLFVALRGEHFDGQEYVAQANSVGATAALVRQVLPVHCRSYRWPIPSGLWVYWALITDNSTRDL